MPQVIQETSKAVSQTLTLTLSVNAQGERSISGLLANGKVPMQALEMIADMEKNKEVKSSLLNNLIGESKNGNTSNGIISVKETQIVELRNRAGRVKVKSSLGSDTYR
jgi:hypothetical protein